jgi:hypothetical protein
MGNNATNIKIKMQKNIKKENKTPPPQKTNLNHHLSP